MDTIDNEKQIEKDFTRSIIEEAQGKDWYEEEPDQPNGEYCEINEQPF